MAELFEREFEESRPPLYIILDMPPTAHKETKFTTTGIAYSDPEKRKFMIEAANKLREYSKYFLGVRYIRMDVLFVCERPDTQPIVGIPKSYWNDPDLELLRCSRPDLDNYEKSLQDILSYHIIKKRIRSKTTFQVTQKEVTGAGIIDDDSCIVEKLTRKIYAKPRESARIEIKLREIDFIYRRKTKRL